MRILIALLSITISACSSYPEALKLQFSKTYLTSAKFYYQNQKESTQALAIEFEGNAPIAFIKNSSLTPQFRCHLTNDKNNRISRTEFADVFYIGPAIKEDEGTRKINVNTAERYKYVAIAYKNLETASTYNIKPDINLLSSEYEAIKCQLIGVTLAPGFMYSNPIFITKNQIKILSEHR